MPGQAVCKTILISPAVLDRVVCRKSQATSAAPAHQLLSARPNWFCAAAASGAPEHAEGMAISMDT